MADYGGHVRIRGEGLNNLVLTYSEAKKVYRLMKNNSMVTHENVHSETEEERTEKINQILENQVAYVENVIRPQILSQFIALHEIVRLPDKFAETVESDISEGRLEVRTKKRNLLSADTTIDPATKSAVMLPDLCFVTDADNNRCLSEDDPDRPTISVEIKPKKGFMPEEGTLPIDSAIKYTVCKFCIHQRLKTKEGRWSQTSHYCPIDMFSGNRARMKHALYGLCETPQHNLKICMNGDEIYGKHVKEDLGAKLKQFFDDNSANGIKKHLVLSEFLDLVVEALLYVPKTSQTSESRLSAGRSFRCCDKNSHPSCSNTSTQLNSSSSKSECCSSSVQGDNNSVTDIHNSVVNSTKSKEFCDTGNSGSKLVNGFNCHKLSQHCQKSSYQPKEYQEFNLPHYSILGQVFAVQALDTVDIENIYPLFLRVKEHLKQHPSDEQKWNLYGPFTSDTWLRPCKEELAGDSLEYAVDMIKRFNVSKTLQDCSLMVAFQRLDSSSTYKGPILTDRHGRKFRFSVSVIDLDYKPFNKVQKWYDLENEMLRTYSEVEMRQGKRSAV